MIGRKSLVCALVAATLAAGAAPSHAYRLISIPWEGWTTNDESPSSCNDPSGFTHWATANTSWYLNTSGQGAGKAAAIFNGMNAWNFVTNASHNLHYAGTTTANFGMDGINSVSFGYAPCSGCYAITGLLIQSGQVIVEADIVYKDTHTFTTNGSTPDVWSIAVHEFGHALGIHHSDQGSWPPSYPTMINAYIGTNARSLESDDRAALQCSQTRYPPSVACIPDGGVDDSGIETHCCSGMAMSGSSYCPSSGNCYQICATPPVNGCIPSGGIDDTLGQTTCCSGMAVPGSGRCLNPGSNVGFATCFQTCA